MKISFDNTSLKNIFTEQAVLESASSSGTDVSLTIDDNNNLSQNDYIMVGALMNPKTEIAKISASVSAGQTIVADSLTFSHNPTDIIQKMSYNQIKLYSATTETGTKTLESTKDIDVDQRYTDFSVSDSATGYFFFTLYNSQTSGESDYSYAIPAETQSDKTREAIRTLVEIHYDYTDLEDDKLRRLMDMILDEIYTRRKWRWREATATFTTTSGTTTYDIEDDVGITDFGQLVSARTDKSHLRVLGSVEDDILALNTAILTTNTIFEWAGNFHIRVNGSKDLTIKYLKNSNSLITPGTKTAIKLPSAIAFGVLKHLYFKKDTELSDRFDREYERTIRMMIKDDE